MATKYGGVISVRADIEKVSRVLGEVSGQVMPKALTQALNEVGGKARVAGSRIIRERYNVASRYIKNAIKLEKASPVALRVRLEATGKPLPLIAFKPRQVKTGVSVSIIRGSRKTIRSAFIATMKSGHRGVFARGAYSGGRFLPGTPRLPIAELETVGVPQTFGSRVVQRALEKIVKDQFPVILANKAKFLLSKLRRR